MALARVKTWSSGEVLNASDLNAEFDSILNNATSLVSPVTAAFDFDGQTITLDAAAATQVVSSAAVSWNFTSGAKTGTPSTSGSVERFSAQTFTDSNTAGSGTATAHVFYSIAQPTLAATNATVTTTDAATWYIANAPAAGTNETITSAWALWTDDGAVRHDLTKTVVSSASAVLRGLYLPAVTETISGSTNITTATGFNLVEIGIPTLSAASALTITNAATVYIAGAPATGGAGPSAITNAYSLWVDAGNVRFDGSFASNLLFVDATYDIGASGATRPRDLFLSRNAVIGGTIGVTGTATLAAANLSGDMQVNYSSAGASTEGVVVNSDNTNAASHARFRVQSGGASGGDPFIRWAITGAQEWTAGIDNSDSDSWKLAVGTALGTTDAITVTTAGKVDFPLGLAGGAGITLGTEQATTSGTSIDFTSIPAGVKRITVMLEIVSTNGTSELMIQIGDAGGIENTSYVSTANVTNFTTGFGITSGVSAATNMTGVITLVLKDATNFTWMEIGSLMRSDNIMNNGTGSKSLSATLDRIRLTTVNGTDIFDAGSINIMYE